MLNRLGKYDGYKEIDWNKVERLVFVCAGNICRSAFAEAVAKSLGMNAISCGVQTDNGKKANKKAINTACHFGIGLTKHITRKIDSVNIKEGDLFIAFEPTHLNNHKIKEKKQNQVALLGLLAKSKMPYIHDPYGMNDEYFKRCFMFIKYAVEELSENFKKECQSN